MRRALPELAHRLCVAPMMDWTDRHCRYLHRLVSPRARLYTEMVVAQAILRGDRARLLDFDPAERPVALQLGGSDPAALAEAARLGEAWGYDEINLNVGCPSDRVQNATFGACLMGRPALVAECVAAMRGAVRVPVTVKCRIGIDDRDDYAFLETFVRAVVEAGCGTLIVHARKAILQGLSPKQNREIPPLVYPTVWRVKRDFPALTVVINGGLKTVADALRQWQHVDGVMLGREAYHNPGVLAALEAAGWPDATAPGFDPATLVDRLEPYVREQLARGQRLHAIMRHALGLYAGRPGARAWRRVLSEFGNRPGADFTVVERAREAAERGGAAPAWARVESAAGAL
ncbi:MAG: tRNA dihydrouridine(20/20a) synthase DusA [Pseudomonadota bacterium]